MVTTDFQGKQLSMLGFGTMRLPVDDTGAIDEKQTADMVRYALTHGVNYFDTAHPYHAGMSEVVIGKILKEYPRNCYYLADKFPGHQIADTYDPAAMFESQLKKCQVDYFDFYLLHNVYENSLKTYMDPRWGIIDYFKEQKAKGRIKHLGFSTHADLPLMREFLELYGQDMEFCQIQLNWVDWTLQQGKEKVELLNQYNIPIWIMEPLRGGKLCSLAENDEAALKALLPGETVPGWGLRFLQGIPGIQMVLSGMSNMQQLVDNISTYAQPCPLNAEQTTALLDIAESMKDAIPCTACRYCTEYCPQKLDIPMLLNIYNNMRFAPAVSISMRMEAVTDEERPSACIGCGQCARMCPQHIDIPAAMKGMDEALAKLPRWSDICREREEAQRKLAGK